ncbi:M23 family metallopeptidase [Paraurantiacibacter namhicola]|uniref:Murein hydrolase activator NlpD n=1 Tax=Paraurantiacibacter namhicola TaxID=645517 RepID=A0A1C7DB57_9SPHN|nr:M23 family metallopeptidase [Paraurantiacibacter namhicola]ANU08719.1 Murein hydrolase activator NlpD precursor [Paraurantiacibacter namhicola]
MRARVAFIALAALALVAAGDPKTETVHVVEDGETLKGIANRAGVPLSIIAEANGLAEPYVVKRGQKLVIPRQRSHTVKPGESLSRIAERYGVPQSQIALANGIDNPGTIRSGQRLIIPAVMPERAARAATTPTTPYFRRPHDGKVLLGWARRADGGGHEGVDFAVNAGDMVRASASGTVLFAGAEPKRFGQLVIIDHGNGWQTRYGHLARVTVATGDPVKAGERIGIGGQGGVATRPELHFEIRRNGTPVNPAPRLRLAD